MGNSEKISSFNGFRAVYNLWDKKIIELTFSDGFSEKEIEWIEQCISKEFERTFEESLIMAISEQNLNLRWALNNNVDLTFIEFIMTISKTDQINKEFVLTAIRVPEKKIKPSCADIKDCVNYDALTQREKEILKQIIAGSSNKQIATNLFISKNTVDIHRTNIYKKLNIRNQKELLNSYYVNLNSYCYCCLK